MRIFNISVVKDGVASSYKARLREDTVKDDDGKKFRAEFKVASTGEEGEFWARWVDEIPEDPKHKLSRMYNSTNVGDYCFYNGHAYKKVMEYESSKGLGLVVELENNFHRIVLIGKDLWKIFKLEGLSGYQPKILEYAETV